MWIVGDEILVILFSKKWFKLLSEVPTCWSENSNFITRYFITNKQILQLKLKEYNLVDG